MGDPVDMTELATELWRAFLEQQFLEMLGINWQDGPFRAGWESAIEELRSRIGDEGA